MPTVYVNLSDINKLQTDIMDYIDWWVRSEKSPVPQKKIVEKMTTNGIKDFTTVNALNSLLKKGYIRRAYIISNSTYYVQLRRVS